jgi:hypothetical protein
VELLEQMFYKKGANLHPDPGGEKSDSLGIKNIIVKDKL